MQTISIHPTTSPGRSNGAIAQSSREIFNVN